jgi:hypothetical protein
MSSVWSPTSSVNASRYVTTANPRGFGPSPLEKP